MAYAYAVDSLVLGNTGTGADGKNAKASVVRIDALSKCFPKAVTELGGNPEQLLDKVNIPAAMLDQSNGLISYRALILLLERTASELECPDFGLKLASHCDGGLPVLGPLEIAMRHSPTILEAYEYCAKNLNRVYSPVVHFGLVKDDGAGRSRLSFDILLDGLPFKRQAIENSIGLTYIGFKSLCRKQYLPREVWFMHKPLAPLNSYRDFFDAPVKFGMPCNAIFLSKSDITEPIPGRNDQIYEMATTFIDKKFPASELFLSTQVRIILRQLLGTGRCNQATVSEMLLMGPRTFQRRLKEEGTSFEEILDAVRRDIALDSLLGTKEPLTKIAEKLDYSETSVLTRSCYRWFMRSPRDLRKEVV